MKGCLAAKDAPRFRALGSGPAKGKRTPPPAPSTLRTIESSFYRKRRKGGEEGFSPASWCKETAEYYAEARGSHLCWAASTAELKVRPARRKAGERERARGRESWSVGERERESELQRV